MKNLIHLFATALILATAGSAFAADDFRKILITGTVQTQLLLGPGKGKILTAPLNNKRIFQEFGVSPQDYELVFNVGSFETLLVPKHTGANLPQIKLIVPGSAGLLVDTTAHVYKFQTDIVASPATNIFKDLAGELAGSITFHGPIDTAVVDKIVFSVAARGTDPAGGIAMYALMKFKVVSGAPFVPQP